MRLGNLYPLSITNANGAIRSDPNPPNRISTPSNNGRNSLRPYSRNRQNYNYFNNPASD
jgi:hypothetical protein